MSQYYPDAFERTLTRSYHYADPQLYALYQSWKAEQDRPKVAAPTPIPVEPSPPDPLTEQEADSENFLSAGPGLYGASLGLSGGSGAGGSAGFALPTGVNNPALSQASPWGAGGSVDPNESIANQPGRAGPNGTSGGYSTPAYGYGTSSWSVGSGTSGAGSGAAGGGGGGASGGGGGGGGYNSGGGGSSTTYMRPAAQNGLSQSDVDKVMARMDNMFTSLSNRASQRADAAMANFRGDPAGAAARQYLTDTFAQGLTTGMADEYAGRLRNAQAARGMSFGGASSRDEAAMLVSMSEKRREILLPQMLKDSLDTAMLPAQLEAAYAANYGSAAKSAVNDASVYLDALKSRSNTSTSSQYTTRLRDLFG